MKRQNLLEQDPHTSIAITIKDLEDFSNTLIENAESRWIEEKELKIYDNRSLCKLLGVNRQTVAKYRTDGLLGYSRQGDKFWYTQHDVEKFLERGYRSPFS